MARLFPSVTAQTHSSRLHNRICPLDTPVKMAQVSSHLRNYAVAEVIGFIALLDGHPGIANPPTAQTSRANFQQAQGTIPNPFAHAIPSDVLLSGTSLARLYSSQEARREVERVFGMGVMAPDDWQTRGTFPHQPKQHNTVETIAERHRYGGGLVAAFKACGEAAVNKGVWDGSGKRRHNLGSVTRFVSDIYENVWLPGARSAYTAARSHFATQLLLARNSDPERLEVLEYRHDIVEIQIRVLEQETSASPEAARNVWKLAASETWS